VWWIADEVTGAAEEAVARRERAWRTLRPGGR
jgi:hypothetical protein